MEKWVHIIGICGVTTSGVAIMFKNLGYRVTGSDKGFFPPVSTYLTDNQIQISPGFKAERLTNEQGKHPDIVVLRGTLSENNAEISEAKKLKLETFTFPEILHKYVELEKKSIVVAGTYGKTTITSLIAKIFKQAGIDISYMLGAVTLDFKDNIQAKNSLTKYSVIEGDEYINSYSDLQSKFNFFKPNYLVINAIEWEHTDVFKSENDYVNNFKTLVNRIPPEGLVIANANNKNVVTVCKEAKAKVIYYSINKNEALIKPDWYFLNDSKPLPTLIKESSKNEILPYKRNVLGNFNDENILAATVLTYELGVAKERIQEAISDFKGSKRRLEIRYQNQKSIIIDDFGSSPPKAKGSIEAVKDEYPEAKIVVVFEPNSGNRTKESLPLFKNCFLKADYVFFPKFTKLPSINGEQKLTEIELYDYLKESLPSLTLEQDDKNLIIKIENIIKNNNMTIVLFLGSHSFRGMIDKLIDELKTQNV